MIQCEGLVKRFGERTAVSDVSFATKPGEVFGLLGPNGAGKTTTINMLCGVLRPDAGRVLFDGKDIWTHPLAVKRHLGVVPQEIALYEDLTARDNLRFWGSLYGLGGADLNRRIDENLERVGLAARAKDKPKTFSGGMKRRLNLCMGLLHEPRALLLDEPTVGIDPQARLAILDVVRAVAEAGTTVLYTTHHMEEAEELCDRIAILDHGKILTCGDLPALRALAGERETLRLSGSFGEEEGRRSFAAVPGVQVLNVGDGQAVLALDGEGAGLTDALPRLLDPSLGVDDVSVQRPNLQSVFLRLTGRELRD